MITETQLEDHSFAQTRFQIAFWISMFAISAHYSLFLIPGLIDRDWEGELGGYFVFPAIFIGSAILIGGAIIWLFGFKFLRFVSWLIYQVFGSENVTYEAWNHVIHRSLWTLPWTFGVGAFVYISYFALESEYIPDDAIVGLIGNALGAFSYLTIFHNWYRLIKKSKESLTTGNPTDIEN